MNNLLTRLLMILTCMAGITAFAQVKPVQVLKKNFQSPPPSASPWVFWYWMQASVSKQGITADIEAMKEVGIEGAYLMPIKGPANPPYLTPPVVQLTPEWWEMVRHAFAEAARLGIRLGFHVSDGFALAGGPWITPELSMQKLVWSKTIVRGGSGARHQLQQPPTNENYYRDVAVFAVPVKYGIHTTQNRQPVITSSKGDSIAKLLIRPDNKRNFSSDENCSILYAFDQPFTCRSILIRSRNNYGSNRLLVEASHDGKRFWKVKQLVPPRHGWQDWDADYTHSVPTTTARYFRFVYDKAGSEPGAEDLDAAKWRPSLKVYGIELSSEARVDGYEGKNGQVWRVAAKTAMNEVPDSLCIAPGNIINLTAQMDQTGNLNWQAPAGEWLILRMGHTSTGHRNETGGGGKGLETDKFNAAAIALQFDKWFGEVYRQVDTAQVKQVLRYFHVDSWECGSQNWSSGFAADFKRKRGYDPLPLLPVMAGVPVGSADASENFLLDIRQTIAELIDERFYQTLARLAHAKGVDFSAESVAPTMVSDGMLHYRSVDLPMGEFWLRSPTHDKPNDMLDAISGAHIYGKNIVQAEGFTELRMAWDEHPGMLKTLLDRNFALGMNRLFFHVFVHNPWMDKKPGMTLDPIGLYFQRDQTWWKHSKGLVDYIRRCQALLQAGRPVTDIAVFTGEDLPRRSVLPDRLVDILPGIFGKEVVEQEKQRLRNEGQPLRQLPAGVTHSANMADPENWTNALNGYAYDSYNKDALLRLSTVKDGKIQLSTGASYRLLIVPGAHRLSPNKNMLSDEAAACIRQFVKEGAVVMLPNEVELASRVRGREKVASYKAGYDIMGKGRLLYADIYSQSFSSSGIFPDLLVTEDNGGKAKGIAWNHRAGEGFDIYFISNQKDSARQIHLSLRVAGKVPQLWDPLNGEITGVTGWTSKNGRTDLPVFLPPHASLFVVLQQPASRETAPPPPMLGLRQILEIKGTWELRFDPRKGGPREPQFYTALRDWSTETDTTIRYYSGIGSYTTRFSLPADQRKEKIWLNLGEVANSAEVFVNGTSCGFAWTYPYRVDISGALRTGDNELRIDVANTWANRLIGDSRLPAEKRVTSTSYPFRMEGKPLLKAGLLGPVVIETGQQ